MLKINNNEQEMKIEGSASAGRDGPAIGLTQWEITEPKQTESHFSGKHLKY